MLDFGLWTQTVLCFFNKRGITITFVRLFNLDYLGDEFWLNWPPKDSHLNVTNSVVDTNVKLRFNVNFYSKYSGMLILIINIATSTNYSSFLWLILNLINEWQLLNLYLLKNLLNWPGKACFVTLWAQVMLGLSNVRVKK